MVSKAELRKNKVGVAILLFMFIYGIFYALKPAFAYNEDGTLKPFGLGYTNRSVLPISFLVLIFAIISYLFTSLM